MGQGERARERDQENGCEREREEKQGMWSMTAMCRGPEQIGQNHHHAASWARAGLKRVFDHI